MLLPSGEDMARSGLRRGFGRRLDREGELTSRADLLVVAFVRFDDALHQGMAHHVLVIELHEADAFHALKHFHRVDQAAAARSSEDRSE